MNLGNDSSCHSDTNDNGYISSGNIYIYIYSRVKVQSLPCWPVSLWLLLSDKTLTKSSLSTLLCLHVDISKPKNTVLLGVFSSTHLRNFPSPGIVAFKEFLPQLRVHAIFQSYFLK